MLTIYLALVVFGLFLSTVEIAPNPRPLSQFQDRLADALIAHYAQSNTETDRVFWQARNPEQFAKLPKIWQDLITDYDLIGEDCFKLYKCESIGIYESIRREINDQKTTVKIGKPAVTTQKIGTGIEVLDITEIRRLKNNSVLCRYKNVKTGKNLSTFLPREVGISHVLAKYWLLYGNKNEAAKAA